MEKEIGRKRSRNRGQKEHLERRGWVRKQVEKEERERNQIGKGKEIKNTEGEERKVGMKKRGKGEREETEEEGQKQYFA